MSDSHRPGVTFPARRLAEPVSVLIGHTDQNGFQTVQITSRGAVVMNGKVMICNGVVQVTFADGEVSIGRGQLQ